MKPYVAVLAGFWLLAPSAMRAAASPAGVWEGTINTPNGDLLLVVNLHLDAGKWAGELDVPIRAVSGLPLASVNVDGTAISFPLPGPGEQHFDGKLSEDGKGISGNLTAAGQPIPLDLKWKSEPRAVQKTQANTGDVQVLEGVWEGVLDAHDQHLHVRFNFTKNGDGSITATFDSIDQGVNGLPVASISRTADIVKLDIKAVGCSYEGTLSKDASAITGTFTQGDSIPLNLQRKKAGDKN
jgi:hypothetical protein